MDSIANPAPAANRITGVGVLDRSVLLLELLADGPRPLRWLSEHSRPPPPTAHRLLVALEAHGLVGRDATGAFRLGPRLTELAFRADPGHGPGHAPGQSRAGPAAGRHPGESVQLYVRSGDKRLCIAARDAGTGLRDTVPVGALLPLAAGSGGKVLLAWAPDAARFDACGRGRAGGRPRARLVGQRRRARGRPRQRQRAGAAPTAPLAAPCPSPGRSAGSAGRPGRRLARP